MYRESSTRLESVALPAFAMIMSTRLRQGTMNETNKGTHHSVQSKKVAREQVEINLLLHGQGGHGRDDRERMVASIVIALVVYLHDSPHSGHAFCLLLLLARESLLHHPFDINIDKR